MHIVVLALGSNVGNKKYYLDSAIKQVQEYVDELIIAPFYETDPVGYKEQDIFLNTVIKGKTKLTPEQLLMKVKKTEEDIGRIIRFKNGPREIDIDILFYDSCIINLPQLVIPHPRLHMRDFVLQPLHDINSSYIHPLLKKSVKTLLEQLPQEDYSIRKKYDKMQIT